MQARYYDPVIGRFLSIDPVTFMETGDPNYFSRYSYTANDPINRIDPDRKEFLFVTDQDRTDFTPVMTNVTKKNPELLKRMETMALPGKIHVIMSIETASNHKNKNIRALAKIAPVNISRGDMINESNGVGTDTLTIMDPNNSTDIVKQDGSAFTSSPEGTFSHEALDHGHKKGQGNFNRSTGCLLYTSPSPRDRTRSRMPSSA